MAGDIVIGLVGYVLARNSEPLDLLVEGSGYTNSFGLLCNIADYLPNPVCCLVRCHDIGLCVDVVDRFARFAGRADKAAALCYIKSSIWFGCVR